jgi:hypothetical protein
LLTCERMLSVKDCDKSIAEIMRHYKMRCKFAESVIIEENVVLDSA